MRLRHAIKLPLSNAAPSWQLVVLGAIVGLIAAFAIVAMRQSIEAIQLYFGLGHHDSFGAEGQITRMLAPLVGALVILFIAFITHQKYHRMGIPFVLHRQRKFNGFIPIGNTINQFFSAIAALASGFSVGKEGPAVHVGAGSASYLSQKLNIPHNSMRILTSCGIAAGIAATFNAPLAAVVFVLEVVLQQFRIHSFLPLMVASLIGSTVSQQFFGDNHDYAHIAITTLKLDSIGPFIVLGLIVGIAATIFNRSLLTVMKASSKMTMGVRLPLAGCIVGIIAWFIPHVVGTEAGALNIAFSEQPELSFIALVLIGKFLATICALGLGIPGGVIGVLYALGALLGSVLVWSVMPYLPEVAPYASMAIMICMVALMASSLNAPLAALVAILEISQQATIIFPSLLVVVPAIIVAQQMFGTRSLFIEQLEFQKLPYKTAPVYNTLQDTGVLSLLRRKFHCVQRFKADESTSISKPVFIKPDPQIARYYAPHAIQSLPILYDNATLADVYQELAPNRDGYVLIVTQATNELIGFVTWRSLSKHLHREYE
ncbi:chloride channel protein [Psychrobium sp. MM17-31]|uniref:chloride channel protein n=1 Tax=Psychrobium sp. MM17-31 TaxID=2917758 RepID=UPI001EF6015C|nr:chloride channel protein [Psychrobium sp. MM17-31]MCG7531421.1 chloride channel protein [Psychrobium sp. MM17-31]